MSIAQAGPKTADFRPAREEKRKQKFVRNSFKKNHATSVKMEILSIF